MIVELGYKLHFLPPSKVQTGRCFIRFLYLVSHLFLFFSLLTRESFTVSKLSKPKVCGLRYEGTGLELTRSIVVTGFFSGFFGGLVGFHHLSLPKNFPFFLS